MAQSQCCPYVGTIEVIPAIPSTTDDVKIVTMVTTPNLGAFISSSHAVIGNTIEIEACYFSGFLTATQTFYDTLNIGFLNPGVFSIHLTAYQSSDTICDYTDTNTALLNITVLDLTNEVVPIDNKIGRLYPNPSSGSFTIDLPEQIDVTQVRIRSISGKLVYEGAFHKEMSVDCAPGIYMVELIQNTSILGYHRLLIE